MHQSAMFYGKRFFDTYCMTGAEGKVVVDIGAQNVNGSLREVTPEGLKYIGVDFVEGKGVDVILSDPYSLPFEDASVDVVVCSSCFEHSEFFWLVILEILLILKPGGLVYLNVPSNGFVHRWPVDCWRFYPDAGHAMVSWAKRNGYNPILLESFVGKRSQGSVSEGGMWNDFVAVILKDGQHAAQYPDRVVHNLVDFSNGYSSERELDLNPNPLGPDFSLIETQSNTISHQEEQIVSLTHDLQKTQEQLYAVLHSKSMQITKPLREAMRWVSNPKGQARRYAKGGARLSKSIYQSLPLSYKTKSAHRQWLEKYFPKVLIASGSHFSSISEISIPPVARTSLPDVTPENRLEIAISIKLYISPKPVVSVIIPIYGNIDYTIRCIASISASKPRAPFEIIVVDDCSPDESVAVLSTIEGIVLLQNRENLGFIRSCNAGAKMAQGSHLLFLNNDTEVTSGWLDELLHTFSELPGTGLVGSKLIYPDGKLQEAGGIIWRDGSAWNFGRFQDPHLPVYNYAREVDYCSGASIMIQKSLFNELGGFDEHYLPAYCEDSDIALKIRKKGFRVIYQPMSTVIHYEGVTSGTDISQGVKSYQVDNSKKLFERWKDFLQSHHANGEDVDNEKDRRATRRVLVIDHCTPTPNQDAGSVTVFNLLLLLREMDFQVTFIPEDNYRYIPQYTAELQRAGIEVLYAPYVTSVMQHLKEYGHRYDLAFLFRPGVVERHVKTIRKFCPKAKVLFHTVDLHFLRMSREAKLQSDREKQSLADKMKERELAAILKSDASIVHSTAELDLLRHELPNARLHVFPLIMEIKGLNKTFSERRDIVFVGGYQHSPNVDAVLYFASEIMPILRNRLPGVRCFIVGSKPPAEVQELASNDIIVSGFVEDLAGLLENMRVSVAPLRFGAGIKGKIGTSMAVGLPVVATSLAAEGMSLSDGENILIADGATAFADAIEQIYHNEVLWNKISQNGLAFSEKAWGGEAAWEILSGIVADLGLKPIHKTRPISLYRI